MSASTPKPIEDPLALAVLFAAINRARRQHDYWCARARPQTYYDERGNFFGPPPLRQIKAWDDIIEWKRQWLEYGVALVPFRRSMSHAQYYRDGKTPSPT